MPLPNSMIDKMNKGNSHKRKHCLQKEMKSKSNGRVVLTLNSHAGNEGNSFDLPPRIIGEDGHYYECVICDAGGDLLCCDTCPGTYHLQCLSPPLDSVPAGNWQCQNCSQVADLSTPLSSLQTSKKLSASSDKNHPADALHSLADAGALMELASEKYIISDQERNIVNHNGDVKERETSFVAKGIKVYTRRAGKKAVKEGDAKLTACTEALLNLPPIHTEQAYRAMQNNLNASKPHQPNESDPKLKEQGSKSSLQATNTTDSNINQVDKLWILRDTMQELMKGQGSLQSGERKELNQAAPPKSGETVKEKFARLRERQKQKVALRNRSWAANPGSRIAGHEPLLRLDAGTIESVRVHTPENGPKLQQLFLDPLPLRQIRPSVDELLYKSADDILSCLNSCDNLSILRDARRFCWLQERLAGKAPFLPWLLNSSFQDFCSHDISSLLLNPTTLPQGGNYYDYPWTTRDSNVALSSKSTKKADRRMMVSNNSAGSQGMMTFWLEQELDSLWVGVRKFGQGNWEEILKDSSLYFSELKTAEHLAHRWKMEKHRMLNSAATSDNFPCTDLRLNSMPSSVDQLARKPRKPVTQNLLLGGLIGIPKMKMGLGASVHEKTVIKIEDDVSSEATISG